MLSEDIFFLAKKWVLSDNPKEPEDKFYCADSIKFQSRLAHLENDLSSLTNTVDFSLIVAATGEIGNNSFDHNLGNWKDIPGIYFGYSFSEDRIEIVLADRGRGIFNTLKKVKPEIKNDQDALLVAFTERISGRAPEKRGNGLKFVRENVQSKKMHLIFYSGTAKAELNDQMKIEENSENIGGCLAIITL